MNVGIPVKMLVTSAILVTVGVVACPKCAKPTVDAAALGRVMVNQPEIRSNYSYIIEGTDTVCGKECYTVRLKPPRKHMPWRQLWLDKQTLKIMATRSWNSSDRIVGTTQVK